MPRQESNPSRTSESKKAKIRTPPCSTNLKLERNKVLMSRPRTQIYVSLRQHLLPYPRAVFVVQRMDEFLLPCLHCRKQKMQCAEKNLLGRKSASKTESGEIFFFCFGQRHANK
eukprot:c21566_g2_i2 orf=259-600(+)